MNGFACLISELGGGLPDLGWFLFVHHFKEESQARFLSYQAPVGGTVSAINESWFEEVMSNKKKQILDKSILLVSLSSSEVDFPTSDEIFVHTILKRRVRRVF